MSERYMGAFHQWNTQLRMQLGGLTDLCIGPRYKQNYQNGYEAQ